MVLIVTSYVAKKVYTKIKTNKNIQKIKRKRKEIQERKTNLEQRLKIDGVLISPERKAILNKDIKELLKDDRVDLGTGSQSVSTEIRRLIDEEKQRRN